MTQPCITDNNNVNVHVTALSMDNTWIIDSGVSDHMTKYPRKLQPLKPSSQPFIYTANGGTSPIIGEELVVLTDTLRLDTVLVVPTLDHNLLSLSQVTSSLNCTVTFCPLFCIFQDILTRGTIGYGVK
ncbi:hypothetical protein RDI58_020128 [Solanum bulbocastanum]|uniref:Retrovirus-related Pol polyprotein from transposon TNT 1-94-like beta-barrel domain-containing protein n=1 Tax=Solanum bulbocastanum TaxID=147425 RepID=A0AAN8TC99_SOLBU